MWGRCVPPGHPLGVAHPHAGPGLLLGGLHGGGGAAGGPHPHLHPDQGGQQVSAVQYSTVQYSKEAAVGS